MRWGHANATLSPLIDEALAALGWTEELAALARKGMRPARVSSVYAARVDVWTAAGPMMVSLRSKALRENEGGVAVGDWAVLHPEENVVEAILPRRTAFLRQAAGERSEPQVIAANVDRVFVVTSADADFNVRRVERYLVAIAAGGAEGQIVLTKADIATDLDAVLAEASRLAETFATSARSGVGLDTLTSRIPRGTTAALVGSSGVGKSALVNRLLGREAQLEGSVRAYDGRGRHTTTRRELFALASGGLLIDTPGMRELKPWLPGGANAFEDAFEDVAKIAATCRYRDCLHEGEPDCGIREAVVRGELAEERLAAWKSLRAEQRVASPRQADNVAKRRQRTGAVALRKRIR